MSDYEQVSRGSLKLKNTGLGVSKKSKKHKKKKEKPELGERQREFVVEQTLDISQADSAAASSTSQGRSKKVASSDDAWMTEAQKKFLAQQEKRQLTRVMEKATKSHKQRVEEFNTHLENLSEHYDIPKVSWTK